MGSRPALDERNLAGDAVPTPTAAPEATPEIVVTGAMSERPESPSSSRRPTDFEGTGDLTIRLREGDTLTDLAHHYYGNVGPRVLTMIRAANPWLDDPDVLRAGEFLVLPAPRLDGSESLKDGGNGR